MPRLSSTIAILTMALSTRPATAQSIIDRVKQSVVDHAGAKADSAAIVNFDRIDGAIRCTVTNKGCIKKAQDAGQVVILTDDKGNPLASQPYIPAAKLTAAQAGGGSAGGSNDGGAPATKVWVNYDFVPGDSVLFAEDFTNDRVGEFPKRFELKYGDWEVATVNDIRYLRSTSGGRISIPLAAVLPQRFTIEFDLMVSSGGIARVTFVAPEDADKFGTLEFNPSESGVRGQGMVSTAGPGEDVESKFFHARAMVDGRHVKVYVNGKRVANAPAIDVGRSDRIQLDLPGSEGMPMLLTNIRIAAGGKTLYDAIAASGRVATHGLLFDTGSDHLRDESVPTLKLIGEMLSLHPDLKLTIEGHTDNVGADATNLALSERRAAAVKTALVKDYHVDASRLVAHGFGSSRPSVQNSTPEGRQTNRRVELVKN